MADKMLFFQNGIAHKVIEHNFKILCYTLSVILHVTVYDYKKPFRILSFDLSE